MTTYSLGSSMRYPLWSYRIAISTKRNTTTLRGSLGYSTSDLTLSTPFTPGEYIQSWTSSETSEVCTPLSSSLATFLSHSSRIGSSSRPSSSSYIRWKICRKLKSPRRGKIRKSQELPSSPMRALRPWIAWIAWNRKRVKPRNRLFPLRKRNMRGPG